MAINLAEVVKNLRKSMTLIFHHDMEDFQGNRRYPLAERAEVVPLQVMCTEGNNLLKWP